eukprot:jgi/Ulvmu1/10327/UM061_0010.1
MSLLPKVRASGAGKGATCNPVPNRRACLWSAVLSASTALSGLAVAAPEIQEGPLPAETRPSELLQFSDTISKLETEAYEAYARRDFKRAVDKLSELIYQQPQSARWSEMRAQVLLDSKNFAAAIMDYNEAMQRTPASQTVNQARLLAGRGLALEGEESFQKALSDYEHAISLAASGGEAPDPFVVNSIGNCYASLQQWPEARAAYLRAAAILLGGSGYRDSSGSSAPRASAAAFAQCNAALMLAQMNDLPGATREMEVVTRRQLGLVDARAALAALYYDAGRVEDAEKVWAYACTNISVGCVKYKDEEWLGKVRRWPPGMVARLGRFLKLEAPAAALI